jgi:predicted  nucleic acid-binding Zn-ribbon protein
MAKDKKSTFPGSLRDNKDAANAEAEKVNTKINEAFLKLAKKMRERADKARSKVDSARKPEKRAVLLRRFELYADAATHLEERLPPRDD